MAECTAGRLQFFFFDAGGGHRSAAMALRTVLEKQYPGWQVELVNLQDLLNPIDPAYLLTGVQSHNIYNAYIKSGFTYGSGTFLRALQAGIKLLSSRIEAMLARHWRNGVPDLVVSFIPNFNGAIYRSLRDAHPSVPYVTIMTDLVDYPPHFWIEDQDQFVICGTAEAARQARAAGLDPAQVIQTSGMVLKPEFYDLPDAERRLARSELGLDADTPTAIISFGGYGSKLAARILKRLDAVPVDLQSIVLCGHNTQLLKQLAHRPACHAVGFTDRVPHFMRLADFFIGKPGPGSISEAIHMGLPVILERNSRTLLQERYNTDWVEEQKLGVVVDDFAKVADAVQFLLQKDRLPAFRCNALRLRNRAVYEIADALHRILAQHCQTRPPALVYSPHGSTQAGEAVHRALRA